MVFSHARGSSIWDPEGNKYLDFLSAYSAVNQVNLRLLSFSAVYFCLHVFTEVPILDIRCSDWSMTSPEIQARQDFVS